MSVRIFLREAPMKLLLTLENGPLTQRQIWKKTGLTYSHVIKLVDIFVDLGIAEKSEKGRVRVVSLTERGEEIAKLFRKAKDFFEKIDHDDRKNQMSRGIEKGVVE
jgi:DNA-binding MarR family transcriptional regulator